MVDYIEKSKVYKGFHYSVLTDDMFAYLHRTCLEILKEIKKVFEDNDIRYIIVGGTLLGAVTQAGYIPWDDDVDLCVFEEDYEKAKDILISTLPDWMYVQCKETETKYFHGWIKVRDKHSKVYPDKDGYDVSGVWVDVYKLKKIQEKDTRKIIFKEHVDYLKRRYLVGSISKDEYFQRIKENHLRRNLIKEEVKALFNQSKNEVYIIGSASKVVIKKEWMFPLKKVFFEGVELPTLNKAESYLEEHYGAGYKEYPPEEKRRVGINKIEFL